jgi:transcriptional regulator with XRE-family HTH domain
MSNRIRAIRKAKGLTLADIAAACDPPTTAQTIGRLETGMRQLSLGWMNRIAAALEVDAASLMRAEPAAQPQIIAELGPNGARALAAPRDALLPSELGGDDTPAPMVVKVTASLGEFRPSDLVWLRPLDLANDLQAISRAMNRDCLVPRPGGRFAFGRLIECRDNRIGLLPPGPGQKQVVIENPVWIALAFMLVRTL